MPRFNLNWLYMIIAHDVAGGWYLTNESGTATKNISYIEFQQYVTRRLYKQSNRLPRQFRRSIRQTQCRRYTYSVRNSTRVGQEPDYHDSGPPSTTEPR